MDQLCKKENNLSTVCNIRKPLYFVKSDWVWTFYKDYILDLVCWGKDMMLSGTCVIIRYKCLINAINKKRLLYLNFWFLFVWI